MQDMMVVDRGAGGGIGKGGAADHGGHAPDYAAKWPTGKFCMSFGTGLHCACTRL